MKFFAPAVSYLHQHVHTHINTEWKETKRERFFTFSSLQPHTHEKYLHASPVDWMKQRIWYTFSIPFQTCLSRSHAKGSSTPNTFCRFWFFFFIRVISERHGTPSSSALLILVFFSFSHSFPFYNDFEIFSSTSISNIFRWEMLLTFDELNCKFFEIFMTSKKSKWITFWWKLVSSYSISNFICSLEIEVKNPFQHPQRCD